MKYLIHSELNYGSGFVKAVLPRHRIRLEEWDCPSLINLLFHLKHYGH